MTQISAEKVKELREKSGAGMMDCKRALSKTNGDLNEALDLLRKEGTVKAAKKAGRVTSEGLVAVAVSPDRKRAALVEVNCETDFVARTDQFQEFIQSVAEAAMQHKPQDLDALLELKLGNGILREALAQMIAKLGENSSVRRFRVLEAGGGEVIGSYLHAGSKIGVLVTVKGAAEDLARDVAMHAAAMSPQYVNRSRVPASVLEREREIAKASPDLANKPAAILDKIIDGKINRFYSEVCLMEQPFIKDATGKKSVGDTLKTQAPGAEVVEMVRFQVGEAVEGA